MFRNDERAKTSRVRRLLPALALLSATGAALSPSTAQAEGTSAVTLGEVSTTVGREEIVPAMKRSLEGELAKVAAPAGKKFVVSASLTKLETKTNGNDFTTSCVISIAVRDGSGSLRGMTNGNGSVVTKRNDPAAEKASLEAAVRGATKALPEVFAKSS